MLYASQLFRAGELTSIYVPTEDDEALRDLVRAREDSKEDQLRARHRLTKFLLRYDLNPPSGTKKWTHSYRDWLDVLKFSRAFEAAWSYRYKPALKGKIRKRQEGQSPEIKAIAWKAQDRLHRKYSRLTSRGKPSGKAIAAIARELAGFVWAIACNVEKAS